MAFKNLKYLATAILIISLFMAPAAAHGVFMGWNMEGTITVNAWYAGNDPMANANVIVESIDGSGEATVIATGITDANGAFSFESVEGISSYRVSITEGEHAITQTIRIGSDGAGGGILDNQVVRAIAGVGWIFGFFGILLYVQSRRELKKKNQA